MRTAFSCFVDAQPRFELQAILWVWSLIRFGEVDARAIHVHAAPAVSTEFRDVIRAFGAEVHQGRVFHPDHPHCNKITQTDSVAFAGYDQVVLCDCDTLAIAPIRLELDGAQVAGRRVDRPLPPLETLVRLYRDANLSIPDTVSVGCAANPDQKTLATNWNGGLYVIRRAVLAPLGRAWAAHAERLIEVESERLGPRMRTHIDQISFGMALVELGASWVYVDERYNAPLHLPAPHDAPPGTRPHPVLVHHHGRQDSIGLLCAPIDGAYTSVVEGINPALREFLQNRLLTDPEFRSVHAAWQAATEPMAEQDLDSAERAFCNPRYTRHTARRLEHLASLRLPLEGKTVLELGAGIGEHSQFFLDRGCTVISAEPRPENCAYMRHREYMRGLHIVVRSTADEALQLFAETKFEIVYAYGLIYHLNNPIDTLIASAKLCSGLYLLETAVGDLQREAQLTYREDEQDPTNAIDGRCALLSRSEIVHTLRQVLPFVYVPRTQPAHEQFLRDWSEGVGTDLNRHRAIFVGSIDPLDVAVFSEDVLTFHA